MKKLLLFVLLFASFPLFAQSNSLALKAGYFAPADLKSGAIFGLDYGYIIDESVTILLGCDFFYRSIRDDADLGDAEQLGVKIGKGEHLSRWTGWHLPLTAKVKVEFPTNEERLRPYAAAGVGYGFTHVSFDKFNNLNSPSSASLTYDGFVWQVGGGVLYSIGSRSQLLFEAMYDGASFEKDEDNNKFTTLNSSGLIIRGGVNFQLR